MRVTRTNAPGHTYRYILSVGVHRRASAARSTRWISATARNARTGLLTRRREFRARGRFLQSEGVPSCQFQCTHWCYGLDFGINRLSSSGDILGMIGEKMLARRDDPVRIWHDSLFFDPSFAAAAFTIANLRYVVMRRWNVETSHGRDEYVEIREPLHHHMSAPSARSNSTSRIASRALQDPSGSCAGRRIAG